MSTIFFLILSKGRLKLWAKYSEPKNNSQESFFFSEPKQLDVGIRVQADFPLWFWSCRQAFINSWNQGPRLKSSDMWSQPQGSTKETLDKSFEFTSLQRSIFTFRSRCWWLLNAKCSIHPILILIFMFEMLKTSEEWNGCNSAAEWFSPGRFKSSLKRHLQQKFTPPPKG